MAFQNDIPQANDIISESQDDLLQNFSSLDQIFGVEHYEFSDPTASTQGKHDKSTYIARLANVDPAATEAAVFAKDTGGTDNVVQAVYQIGDLTDICYPMPFAILQAEITGNNGGLVSGSTTGSFNIDPITYTPGAFNINVTFTKEAPSANIFVMDAINNLASVTNITAQGFTLSSITGNKRTRLIFYSMPW